MFFDNFQNVFRVAIVGVLAYIFLIIFLRISGKRTLSKLNAFDLVVTVALGSTLATILLSQSTALVEGLTAFIILIGMQYLVTWASGHWHLFNKLVKSEPRMLFYEGKYLKQAMKAERVVELEIMQAVRSSGYASLQQIHSVILETDGSFSVIAKDSFQDLSALDDVKPKQAVKPG
jgi:uncharacterized membrane protein YcaP (DUF421 family)